MSKSKIEVIETLLREAKKHFDKVIRELPKYYGRYESSSGALFAELYHHGDPDNLDVGSVVFRKGKKGQAELDENLILDRPVALKRLQDLLDKSYEEVFHAVTKDELDEKNAERERSASSLERDNALGTYYKGSDFFRINKFGETYCVQRGFNTSVTDSVVDLTEQEARAELELALVRGFTKDGDQAAETITADDILNMFDAEDAPQTQENTVSDDWEDLF